MKNKFMNDKSKIILFLPFLLVTLLFSSCSMLKNFSNAVAMKDCKYSFNKVSNVEVAGFSSDTQFSFLDIAKITALLNGTAESIPLSMNIVLDVENPNEKDAGFEKMDYILNIDEVDLLSGQLSEPFFVSANSKSQLPINLSVDLLTLLRGESKEPVLKVVKNLLGIGDEESNVQLKIRPTIRAGQREIQAANYIPINFVVGGQKK
jgi:LEA14-like dessication related protein